MELLNENFPEAAKGTALVVLAADEGDTLTAHRSDVAAVIDEVSAATHVAQAMSPDRAFTGITSA